MAKYIKNDSGSTDTWSGQELTNGQVLEFNQDDDYRFQIEASTSGSKVETDVLSGDLKVSIDNFTTTLSAADGLAYLKDANAGCIQGILVDDSAKADNKVLGYNATNKKIEYLDVAALTGGQEDLAAVQAKKTTTLTITTSAQDISFDTTDIENAPTILEHDDTNRDNLVVHGSFLVFGIVNFEFKNTGAQERNITIELRLNDTTTLSSSTFEVSKSSTEMVARSFILPAVTSGDFFTMRIFANNTGVDLLAGARLSTFAMTGAKGEKGDTGAAGADGTNGVDGADGDITWQGDWVSQNYVANQAVKYSDGSSYVCHTNTTANQVPTDTNFWDCLAEKGDTGPAGSSGRMALAFAAQNKHGLDIATTTYTVMASCLFPGTANFSPTAIKCAVVSAGTGNTQSVKIFDRTNGLTIAESSWSESTTITIQDLGALSNLSSTPAHWEIQMKISGGANQFTMYDMTVY